MSEVTTNDEEQRSFGSSLQKFSKDLVKSLSNFKFSEELTNDNYVSWSQAMSELLQSINLHPFLTNEDYSNVSLSVQQNMKTKFIITNFTLNHLDSTHNIQARNHLSSPSDPHVLVYSPIKIWSFLKNRHAWITEVKLAAVTRALYACKIQQLESLSAYLDRYENLVREFFMYRGQLSDHQRARMLIDSISTLSGTTTELIHAQVVPLTRQGVADYLREYETRQGWTSPAMREANSADASSHGKHTQNKYRGRCSEDECIGPHPDKDFWAKPENARITEEYLARRQGDQKINSSSASTASTVKGRKKISPPAANLATFTGDLDILSLHASYEDVTPSTAVASSTPTSSQIWVPHDTGATNDMVNNICLFDKSSLKPVSSSNKGVKLAGGGISLAVHSEVCVRLKAGDGSTFKPRYCLYIPELSKNLISGGRLRLKGVRELYDEGDNSSFSLVLNGLAIFNGYIGSNGLMNILIKPVSTLEIFACVSTTTDNEHLLHHQHLGRIGRSYLEIMGDKDCVDGLATIAGRVINCNICHLSKSKQLPYNHTRPRAQKFLENVHVDLSGIIRHKSVRLESYYILFCDDYSAYRHIYPLKRKEKGEVHVVFISYIAMSERQPGERLKQFTLDRGGEFINDTLGVQLRDLGIVLHTTAGYTPQQNGVAG